MAHQSLYRTYRPATFKDVVGQEQVTKPLEEAAKAGKIGHAYLFAGSRGLGKTSVARIFADAIGCKENDLYEIDDDIYEASKKIVFIDHDNIVSEMKKFQNKLGDDIDNIIYLEILASLHYISKAYGKSGFNNLRNKLLEVKPNLREIDNIDEIIEKAHNNIKQFN